MTVHKMGLKSKRGFGIWENERVQMEAEERKKGAEVSFDYG